MEVDSETQTADLQTPLLRADRARLTSASSDWINQHILNTHGENSYSYRTRHFLQWFLTSKYGHYAVILLVSLDVAGIFADFLITLHICEATCGAKNGGEQRPDVRTWQKIDEGLDIVSLVFSSLFVAELIASIFAFGLSYFNSKFHVLDAVVIIASFVVDVALHGPVEEVGSLIVVLRLWRVVKIIEEFSAAGEEQLDALQERIEALEKENRDLRSQQSKKESLQV